MFSLVKFHNNKFAVLKTSNVHKLKGMTCTAKCNGGTYAAFLVCRSDDKAKLAELKKKKETTSKSKNENSICVKSSSHTEIPSLSISSSPNPTTTHCTEKFSDKLNLAELKNKQNTLKSKNEKFLCTRTSGQVSFLPSISSSSSKEKTARSIANATDDENSVELKKKKENMSKSCKSISICTKSAAYNELRSSYTPHTTEIGTIDTPTKIVSEIQRLKSTILKIKDDIKHTANIYCNKYSDLISISNELTNDQVSHSSKEIYCHQLIDTAENQARDEESSCKNSATVTDIMVLNNFLTPLAENKSPVANYDTDPSFDATRSNKLLYSQGNTDEDIDSLCKNNDVGYNDFDLENGLTACDKSRILKSELKTSNVILQHGSYPDSQDTSVPDDMLRKKSFIHEAHENISSHNNKKAILKIKHDSNDTADILRNKSSDLVCIANELTNDEVPNSIYCHQIIDTGAIEARNDELSDKNSAIVTEILVLNNFLTPLEENKPSVDNFHSTPHFEAMKNNKLLLFSNNTTQDINSLCKYNDETANAKSKSLNKSQEESSINNVNKDISSHNNTKASQNSTFLLSTTNNTESSFSEYIPDSVDVTKDTAEITNTSITEKDDIIKEIDDPLNVNKILVPYSKKHIKKHFCIFCKKLQCKLSRHMYLKHKNEEDVKRALGFPKTCQERMKIMTHLRKRGDYEHNTSAKYNTGILIVSRQQQSHCKNIVDDYVCCKTCKGFFSKKTLRIHKVVCGTVKGKRSNYIDGRILTQYIHPAANKALRTKIFPVLRCDEITKSIRYDELVIKFANYLAEKYSLEHQHDMIRANLRLIGRFMIEIKKLDPSINELKEIYKANMYDKCINAIRNVAKWNDTLMGFETPAVAQNLTSLLKKCGKRQRVEFIKEERDDLKNDVNNFLMLWEEEIPLINKKAIEDQSNQKRIKTTVLPSKDDIKKLYNFLKGKIMWAMDNLIKEFCINNWMELVKATLIFIQIFNRRRAGEIERLTCQNFQNKEVITDSIDEDVLKNISKDSLTFAKQFVRISLRGKLGRTVSVLLCPMSIKSIELLLKYRKNAGIAAENNFIFAKPTTSKLTKQYFRACPLLKQYSKECGAKLPESITGTNLRKHIATYTSMINAEEASVDRMAQFMGHHKDIHKSIYRMPIPVAEITCVSKILMGAVGDDVGDDDNDEDDDDDEDEDVIENSPGCSNVDNISMQESNNSHSSSRKKRRSTSPYGKTKRCRWSVAERKAISTIFGDLTSLKRLPSLEECSMAVQRSEILSKRTPQQIKSWIDNQRRHKNN